MREVFEEISDALVKENSKHEERETVWLRQILTLAAGALAAGALAILAGLGPDAPSDGLAQYFLAATWACLGVGITSGAAATYVTVNLTKRIADKLREALVETAEHGEPKSEVFGANKNRWLVLSKWIMTCSLLTAVLCLAAYAMIRTLGL